jgi:hypothetical protein
MDQQAVVRLIEQTAEQWEELDLAGLELTKLLPEISQWWQLKRLILGKWADHFGGLYAIANSVCWRSCGR